MVPLVAGMAPLMAMFAFIAALALLLMTSSVSVPLVRFAAHTLSSG